MTPSESRRRRLTRIALLVLSCAAYVGLAGCGDDHRPDREHYDRDHYDRGHHDSDHYDRDRDDRHN